MAKIVATLSGQNLPKLEVPLTLVTDESSTDTVTVNGTLYTDFGWRRQTWHMPWTLLPEADYNLLKAIYNAQFANNTYPTLTIAKYGVNTPVRVKLNDQNIRREGMMITDIELTLIEKYAL